MILDFVDVSSDDDEVLAREERSFHGKGHSVHVKAEIVDLTGDDDIFEGEDLAHGQCNAAQGTTLLKQEFFRDDGQAEAPQCTVNLQMQELRADCGQTDGSLCATTLEMQEHKDDDGQCDASQSTITLQMLELRADHAQGDAVQCITTLRRQELGEKVGQGHAVQCIATLQMQEHKDVGQGDAAQSTITLQMQELRTDYAQGDAVQCIPTSQRQELSAEVGQGDAGQCIATLQMQEHKKYVGQGDAAQSTVTLQMQELRADHVQGNSVQCITTLQSKELSAEVGQGDAGQCISTLQMQELLADDVQGDAAQSTTSLQMEELTADDGQDTAAQFTPTSELTQADVLCTTALKRQLNLDDGQDAVALCTTTLPRQKSISDGAQGDVPRITTALRRQESDTAHGKGNVAQCATYRQEFLAADYSMQEDVHFRNSAEATTSLSRTQEGSHRVTGFQNTSYALAVEPFSRQFWKAGEYGVATQAAINTGQNRIWIHPKFLHSNATSHKWPFGAIAELLDNAIDEVNNGATFVKIDKMKHSLDGDYALVIEDDGGGMSPESLRHCMSFGFSQKCTTASIGQYGNGFKTSTMRLGADAIVFTCTKDNRRLTQSVGLLSYTFLRRTKCNDIFVPVDIMIAGAPEIRAGHNTVERLTQMHVANRFRYSLRVYASILYLHVPENFKIILCGRAVEPHYVVNDLIYRECIKYRPQVEVTGEVDVITTIGYLSGAPRLDIYGFSVYHKNRLILPYWRAGSCNRQRRGIAGVLEANFIRPTHDKQDFERTGLFQKLEARLKDMATEYWTYHCHLVGYSQVAKRPPPAHYISTTADHDDHNLVAQATNTCDYNSRARASVALHTCANGYNMRYPLHVDLDALRHQMDCDPCPSASNMGTTSCNVPQQSETELCRRRKPCSEIFWRAQKRRNTNVYSDQSGSENGTEEAEEGFRVVLDQNTMLKDECSQLEAAGKLLTSKAEELRKEIGVWRRLHKSLTDELRRGGHLSNPGIGFI